MQTYAFKIDGSWDLGLAKERDQVPWARPGVILLD